MHFAQFRQISAIAGWRSGGQEAGNDAVRSDVFFTVSVTQVKNRARNLVGCSGGLELLPKVVRNPAGADA